MLEESTDRQVETKKIENDNHIQS